MISQSTNQPISQPIGKPSINQPRPGKSDHVDFKQLHKSFKPCLFFSFLTFPCQKSMPSSWYSSSSLSSASSSISSALILLACRNLDLRKRLPPLKKKKHVHIYDRFPISSKCPILRKLKCHLQQTSPKVEAPTPTSALVILFPLPFDIRPPMAGEARELRGQGAIWCTWRVVAVVAVRYFSISFKTFL